MVVRWLWGDSVLSVKLMISIGIILARREGSGMGSENNIPNITELCARLRLYEQENFICVCVERIMPLLGNKTASPIPP